MDEGWSEYFFFSVIRIKILVRDVVIERGIFVDESVIKVKLKFVLVVINW